jgi:hypothetical protein
METRRSKRLEISSFIIICTSNKNSNSFLLRGAQGSSYCKKTSSGVCMFGSNLNKTHTKSWKKRLTHLEFKWFDFGYVKL